MPLPPAILDDSPPGSPSSSVSHVSSVTRRRRSLSAGTSAGISASDTLNSRITPSPDAMRTMPPLLGDNLGGNVEEHLVPNPVTPLRPAYPSFISPSTFMTPAESPSASLILLRANETLEGLSRQLGELEQSRLLESDPDLSARGCCCGAIADCPMLASRDRVDAKLKLCGEIGTALLRRYDALEQKYQRAEKLVEIKRKALADSLRHVANLERANTAHLQKYAEQTRAYEALEKRYTQATHTQTLTQQSLTHVRQELTKTRAALNAQNLSNALDKANDDRLADAERRFEDARTLYHAESRRLKEELKWRRRAEERITDLETKLTTAGREVEDVKAARAKDAQDLLTNAKERLESLHSELSETFQSDHPSDEPDYLRAMEELVATNALLKHDTAELARTLSHTLEDNRSLKDELDELRMAPYRPRSRPLSTELRPLVMRAGSALGHDRAMSTVSNHIPAVSEASRHVSHARVVSAAVPRSSPWGHRRDSSNVTPSLASTMSTDGITSPSLNPVGDSPLARVDSRGYPVSPEARQNVLVRTRSSSGGIGYVHNGVPKVKRAHARRSMDTRKSWSMRAFALEESINEPEEIEGNGVSEETQSGDSEISVHSAEDSTSETTSASRKRASVLLPGMIPSPKLNFDQSLDGGAAYDLPPYTHTEPVTPHAPHDNQRVNRRTLLLLSRSMAVQTDPIPEAKETPMMSPRKPVSPRKAMHDGKPEPSTPGTPTILSETSSMLGHGCRTSLSGPLPSVAELVEFLSKVLTRLRRADIPTINQRLKKHNLPSDVGHVSRSDISVLQTEVAGMAHRFRGLLDQSTVTRRELGQLLELFRHVFTYLFELQSTVNDVTLNPKLAKQMRREAFEDEKPKENEIPPANRLWGIAAPITNYFLPTSQKAATVEPPPPASPSKRQRMVQTSRAAPKLPASTSASTASVTVEFGGSVVHRAGTKAPRLPSEARDVFSDERMRSVSAPVRSTVDNTGSISSRSRESNRHLKGIFAGSHAVPGSLGRPRPVRHASSQIFTGQRSVSERRPRLSTIVDAVLDPANETAVDDEDGPLLERTLRPRGLSDSSIHSTAVLDPITGIARSTSALAPAPPTTADPVRARAVAIVTTRVDRDKGSLASGMLGTLTRRIYSGGTAVAPVTMDDKAHVRDGRPELTGLRSVSAATVTSDTTAPSVATTHAVYTPTASLPIPATTTLTSASPRKSDCGLVDPPGNRLTAHDGGMDAMDSVDAASVPFVPSSLTRWRD